MRKGGRLIGCALDVIEDPPLGLCRPHCVSCSVPLLLRFLFSISPLSLLLPLYLCLTFHATNATTTTMDAHQQQQSMDEHQNFLPQAYPMYASEDEQYLVYQHQMPYNQVVHPGPPPRGFNALVFISAGIVDLIRPPAALLCYCMPLVYRPAFRYRPSTTSRTLSTFPKHDAFSAALWRPRV